MPCTSLKRWSIACLTVALASCGGGSGDGDSSPAPSTQQYPGGIWEGTVGSGTAQRTMVGYIDGGLDGKGGEFFLARGAAGVAGYDALYGLLRTNVAAVQATGVTYFSVQDGKFASGLTLRGTASSDPATGQTTAISGNYANPAGTAAASGSTTPFKLSRSPLNNYPATADLIAGTYRGSGVFGGQWVFTVSKTGALSGRVGGCDVQGVATPRTGTALYSVTMNLLGSETSCGTRAGSQQAGVAILRFDTNTTPLRPNGIWVFARNAIGTDNVYVLNGLADPVVPDTSANGSPTGNWAGTLTLPAGISGDTSVWGSVLPDGGLFLYTNSSFDHNALYGRLIKNETTAGSFSTGDGVYFNRQKNVTGAYTEGVQIEARGNADASGNTLSLTGTFSYPDQPGGYPTSFTLLPDPLYTAPSSQTVASTAQIVGNYQMSGAGFGGHTVNLSVETDGAITGSTTNGCLVVGKLLGGLGPNLYRVEAFGYLDSPTSSSSSISCELSSGPSQSGSASALFDANGRVTGLRLLAAGLSTSGRAHTVFVGTAQ